MWGQSEPGDLCQCQPSPGLDQTKHSITFLSNNKAIMICAVCVVDDRISRVCVVLVRLSQCDKTGKAK